MTGEPPRGSVPEQTGSAPGQMDDLAAAECWRAVGHEAVWHLFQNARGDLDEALWPIEESLQEGRRVDETALRDARRRIDELRSVLERLVAPVADGAEPWDDGAGDTIPFAVMARQLDTTDWYDVDGPHEDRDDE